jgi:ABC-2 type transport system permease protein
VTAFIGRARAAAWLGWQIESNWADMLTFAVYSLLRPLGTALILTGMYWAVAGSAARPEMFAAFYIGNAFHEYVVRVLIGMGWVVVEEREEYETLKYVYASPVGMLTYLWGRASIKIVLATGSVALVLATGWILGVRWSWGEVRWLQLAVAFPLGLVATVFLGFLVAGWALLLPRIAIGLNEGIAVSLYLLSGVIYPVDLLPVGIKQVALALPFTYWYEALRRFVLGHGASVRLGAWSDGQLMAGLALSTLAFVLIARWGYGALERTARRRGRLDQTTLF